MIGDPRYLILATALIFSLPTPAQVDWCMPGARWHYATWQPFIQNPDGYVHGLCVGDTVIDGYTAMMHLDTAFEVSDFTGQLYAYPLQPRFYRIAGDLVLTRFDVLQWDTLAWFGAGPGSQWRDRTQFCESSDNLVHVLDTGTVSLNGTLAKYLDVQEDYLPGGSGTYRIVERIGKLKPVGLCPNHDIDWILCTYTDDEVGEWVSGLVSPLAECGLYTGSHGPTQVDNRIDVHLEQGELVVHLQSNSAILRLHDVLGRVIVERMLGPGRVRIELPTELTGAFPYTISDRVGLRIGSGLLVFP